MPRAEVQFGNSSSRNRARPSDGSGDYARPLGYECRVSWALEQELDNPSEKLILIALASYADEGGNRWQPTPVQSSN